MTTTGARRRQVRRGASPAQRRDRRETVIAVLAAAGVVAFTLFGIWALRPHSLAHRQPRATTLIAVALLVLATVAFLWRRPPSPKVARRMRRAGPIGLPIVAVGAGVLWFVWPGGIIRDYPHIPSVPPLQQFSNPSTSVPAPPSTTAPTATTGPTAPTATTTAPATSAPGG
jgi:fatty acid desaturase